MIKLKYTIDVKILVIFVIKINKKLSQRGAFLKSCVFKWHLKIPRSVIERISRGNTFQSAGAVTWNDLSPNVTLLLGVGVASNKPSEEDLQL